MLKNWQKVEDFCTLCYVQETELLVALAQLPLKFSFLHFHITPCPFLIHLAMTVGGGGRSYSDVTSSRPRLVSL